jgi:hypothetical protein
VSAGTVQDADTDQFPQSTSHVTGSLRQLGWLCGSGADGWTAATLRAPSPPYQPRVVSHTSPPKPAAQLHVNDATPSVQVPPFWHGSGVQSSTFVSQLAPVNPAGQLHVNDATPSVQVPPFWHGSGVQSSTFVSQVAPVKPAGQLHVNDAMPSLQVPPF